MCCRNEKKRVEKSKCGKRCAVLILARLDFRPPAFGGRAILSCNCREEQGAPREGGGRIVSRVCVCHAPCFCCFGRQGADENAKRALLACCGVRA